MITGHMEGKTYVLQGHGEYMDGEKMFWVKQELEIYIDQKEGFQGHEGNKRDKDGQGSRVSNEWGCHGANDGGIKES